MGMANALLSPMGDTFRQSGMEDNKDQENASDSEDHSESLTKVPIQNVPESLVNLSTKTGFAALDAKNLATCKRTAKKATSCTKKVIQDPRSLKTTPALMQDLMSSLKCR